MGIKWFSVIVLLVALVGCYIASDRRGDGFPNEDADLGLAMVKIDGGRFWMGGTEEQSPGLSENELPVHEVFVSDFYLSKYEITVSQFAIFVDEANYVTDAEKNGYSWIVSEGAPWSWEKSPGATWQCDESGNRLPRSQYNRAVIHITWQDANAFCKWLSKASGKYYRLPTESEWEFAARGGNDSRGYLYSGSDIIEEVGWYGNIDEDSNSGGRVHEVGKLGSNELGIYDMSGNVWEWCSDSYASYPSKSQVDPKRTFGEAYVIRGGGWNLGRNSCRNAERNSVPASQGRSNLGFRVAVEI